MINLKSANFMGDGMGALLLLMIIFSGRRNRKGRDFTQKCSSGVWALRALNA